MIHVLPKPLSVRKWVIVTFAGWFAGIVFVLLLSGAFDSIGVEGFQFYVGLGMGLGVGLMQWLTLRRFGFSRNWISASVIGLTIPFLFFEILFRILRLAPGSIYLPISVISGGILVSILQSKVLLAYSDMANRWILRSALGWIVPVLMIVSMDYVKFIFTHNMALFFYNLAMILFGGLVLGLFTGKVLIKILDQKLKLLWFCLTSPRPSRYPS